MQKQFFKTVNGTSFNLTDAVGQSLDEFKKTGAKSFLKGKSDSEAQKLHEELKGHHAQAVKDEEAADAKAAAKANEKKSTDGGKNTGGPKAGAAQAQG